MQYKARYKGQRGPLVLVWSRSSWQCRSGEDNWQFPRATPRDLPSVLGQTPRLCVHSLSAPCDKLALFLLPSSVNLQSAGSWLTQESRPLPSSRSPQSTMHQFSGLLCTVSSPSRTSGTKKKGGGGGGVTNPKTQHFVLAYSQFQFQSVEFEKKKNSSPSAQSCSLFTTLAGLKPTIALTGTVLYSTPRQPTLDCPPAGSRTAPAKAVLEKG